MDLVNPPGLVLPLQKGPFQNNGATPWYCEIGIGTPRQDLKICFDTGSNFNWVTSSLCAKDSCKHYANSRFDITASKTFKWISHSEQEVSFGPWGTMEVETGRDKLSLLQQSQSLELFTDLFLAKDYSGTQFEELDWDGGIGLPSSENIPNIHLNKTPSPFRLHHTNTNTNTNTNEESQFHFFLQLVQMGLINAKNPYISIQTESPNDNTPSGYIGFGTLDESYSSSREYLFLPWSCYQKEASYLWTTSNATINVGGNPIGTNLFFALDTGSSQFKGDDAILTEVYNLTANGDPLVSIILRDNNGIEYGKLDITSDIYKCKIEAGERKGEVISQFQGLKGTGAEQMLLVGSVLMDHLYTVYEYELISDYELRPIGIWIFNKKNGPEIIKTKQTSPASLFSR